MSWNRGVRLSVPRPGTLPLLLLEHDVWLPELGAYLQTLDISVAEPEVVLELVPDCGCNACDPGSNNLLRVVDETISHVIGGPYVALRGEGWHAQWHPDGGGSGGTGRRRHDHAQVMELCRQLAAGEDVQLPPGTQAFVGRPWLTLLILRPTRTRRRRRLSRHGTSDAYVSAEARLIDNGHYRSKSHASAQVWLRIESTISVLGMAFRRPIPPWIRQPHQSLCHPLSSPPRL